MFELIYGLRRGSLLQLLLLILGFTLFGMVLTMVIASGNKVNQTQPNWVKSAAPFATLGVVGQDGELSPSSLQRLQSHRNKPNIIDMATIGIQPKVAIRIGEAEQLVTAALLSDNFAAMLEVEAMTQDINQWPTIAYISHRFWLDYLDGKSLEKAHVVLTDANNTVIKIAGILPASYDDLMLQKPQIWLSQSHGPSLIKVNFGDGGPPSHVVQSIKQQIAMENPIYYGILKLNQKVDELNSLQLQTNDGSADDSFIYTSTKFNRLQAGNGIEFRPKAKEKQILQWQILLLLVFALGLVSGLNLLTGSMSDLIQRQQELSVRIAVGATLFTLLKTLLVEQLPLVVVSFLLMLIALPPLLTWMQFNDYLLASMVTDNIYMGALFTLLIYISVVIFVLTIALFNHRQKLHFSRAKGEQSSKMQHTLNNLTICCQFAVALFGVYFSVTLLTNQWQQFEQLPFDDELVELAIKDSTQSEHSGIAALDLINKVPNTSAISSQSFVMPNTISVQLFSEKMAEEDKVAVNFASVSSDYFGLLNTFWLKGNTFSEQGFVLNLTAATLLAPNDPLSLVGERLSSSQASILGLADKQKVEIAGIIRNLPHFGLYDNNLPMIYGNLLAAPHVGELQLYVLTKKKNVNALQQALEAFVSTYGNFKVSNRGSLKNQISHQNTLIQQLIYTVIALSFIICVLTMTTLYAQLSGYLTMMQNRFAVFLAVGAQPYNVINMIAVKLLVLLGLASAMFFVTMLLVGSNAVIFDLTGEFNISNLVFSLFVMLFIGFISSAIPCWRLLKQPVSNLLDSI